MYVYNVYIYILYTYIHTYIYIYIYMCVCVCVCVCVFGRIRKQFILKEEVLLRTYPIQIYIIQMFKVLYYIFYLSNADSSPSTV